MYRIIFLFFSILFLASCYQQERDCSNFHKGTFEFETLLNGELTKTTFIRNDSIEIDFFQGKSDTATIRWINDCEYILREVHPKSMAEKKAIHIKILTTDKDIYTFEYGLVGATNKQRGTAKKIK
ncbi:DNA topoisomerase IV [Aquimarina sp. MMG016]|uniref:DNA topoisomerase IV n=1 Tax=Aquimarina sp. MMG016 TaxID=2822690 RepID=UPI001B3A03E9|nr:DNA topoisomerase IV [Aquimarina sp. MMG016]MBQ4819136.1 DNA topoisomerase IV [Aquimarina sp. MMG016]